MAVLTIYGASDDCIEVEGDIVEEFPLRDGDEGDLLAFSDGTIVRIAYTSSGTWRVTPVAKGTATLAVVPAVEGDDDNYTDRATLTGDVSWVVHGAGYATARNGVRTSAPADPGGPMITLRLVAEGEMTVTVDRAEYQAAKAAGEADHYLDAYASDIDTRVTVIEPDGTEYDLASGGPS